VGQRKPHPYPLSKGEGFLFPNPDIFTLKAGNVVLQIFEL
jgi:hypothetical protein